MNVLLDIDDGFNRTLAYIEPTPGKQRVAFECFVDGHMVYRTTMALEDAILFACNVSGLVPA
ncbi:hypothetical protein [Rhodococcus koreensis]